MPRAAWGQKIEVLTLDDKFDPKLTLANARTDRGQGRSGAVHDARHPAHPGHHWAAGRIGRAADWPSTGAMVPTSPCRRTYSTCAPYQREVKKPLATGHAGVQRIGVIHGTILWRRRTGWCAGRFPGEPAKALFVESSIAPSPISAPWHPRLPADPAGRHLHRHRVGGGRRYQALRAAGVSGQIITLSNNARGLHKALGEHSRGVVVTQVFLSERLSPTRWCAKRPRWRVKPRSTRRAMVEGFTNAKVLVEALRRAGPNPTRARVHEALESLRKSDLGGLAQLQRRRPSGSGLLRSVHHRPGRAFLSADRRKAPGSNQSSAYMRSRHTVSRR